MTKTIRMPYLTRAACAAAALALVLGTPGTARADDPDDAFPPAKTEGDAAPADDAKAEEAAPDTGWSPPATTPGRAARPTMNDPTLPPPRIVRRRSSTAPTARATTPSAPLPPSSRTPARADTAVTHAPLTGPTTTPSLDDTPAVRVTPRTARSTTTPGSMPAGAPAASTPPLQPRAPTTMPVPRTPARSAAGEVYGITKLHNVPLDRGPGTQDDLALQLDVDYEVRGQRGRDVYVAIWFVRASDGTMIRSAVPAYGDRDGHATLQTRSARVALDAARYKATLRIPYRAFPMGAGEASYDVEARVQVLRTEARGQVAVLCHGSTTFRVYGFDENEAPAEKAEAADMKLDPGAEAALPGDGGVIEDVGR